MQDSNIEDIFSKANQITSKDNESEEGENSAGKSRKVLNLSITDYFKESNGHFHGVVIYENDIEGGQKCIQF